VSTKDKWFREKQQAASKLWADIGSNNVKVYDVQEYHQKASIEVHPPALLAKCTHVEVAVSGDASTGKDWMLIAPYRVDANKNNEKCYDIDPTLLVLDSDTGAAHESGVAAYHQDFAHRTSTIQGFEQGSISQTVQSLRRALTTAVQPLESGSPQVSNALRFMYEKYGPSFGSSKTTEQ
jgi:hypothetical protein